MSTIDWAGFVVFTAVMVGTPGPANMVVMASGATFGARASLPFLAGVILGKQLIIWPLGLGIKGGLDADATIFTALKWASVAYILWLAWRIAGVRVRSGAVATRPPGFWAGLVVHPMNPKAWAMIVAVMTTFVATDATGLNATWQAALGFVAIQCVLQPMWMLAGVQIAQLVAGTSREVWLMRVLAGAMVASVIYALFF